MEKLSKDQTIKGLLDEKKWRKEKVLLMEKSNIELG